MTTAGIASTKPHVHANTAAVIRWRLLMAATLLITSLIIAATLSGVASDEADTVRGAAEWMTSPWGWSFRVSVLLWVAGLTAVGAAAACFAAMGRGGRGAWGVLLSCAVALLGLGMWYIAGLGLTGNREFLRGPWYVLALSGGGLAAVVLLASLPVPAVLGRMRAACAPGGVILQTEFVGRSVLWGLVLAAVVLGGVRVGGRPAAGDELALMRHLNIAQMTGEGAHRKLLPIGGKAILSLDQVPTLGSPDAPHVIYHFFDYTDLWSQACHAALRDARESYGDQIVVLPLVWPLDSTLNPNVPPDVAAQHPGAGEYARLALAVWMADPTQFETFHDYLLTPHGDDLLGLTPSRISMPSLEEARARAVEMVGGKEIERALADHRITRQIRLHVAARKRELGPEPEHNFAPMTSWLRVREHEGTYEGKGVLGPMSSVQLFESLEGWLHVEPRHTQVEQDDTVMELLN